MSQGLLFNRRGYIDPGTGGYLISSLWGWFVGIFTVMAATIAHFFRHSLGNKWNGISKTYKLLVIGGFLVVAIVLVGSFMTGNAMRLPDYDPDLVNVTINSAGTFEGYTLIEGKLWDMEGNIVHEWPYGYLGVIDSNGDLYAQKTYENMTWGRYSWDGDVIWEMDMPIHHEILLTPRNTLIVLTKETHEYNGRMVEFDVIVELNKEGEIIKTWSTWENLEILQQYHRKLELDNPASADVDENTWKNTSIWGANYDYYHTNAVSLVPNNAKQLIHPAFKPGNYIISMRHGSMVFIIDRDSGEVVWRAIYDQVEDNLEGPHSPKMLPDGNILIFDNGRYREWSRLVIIDPVTLDVVWEYKDDDFFSYSQGYVQVLPNGNLFITESEKGHVFELGRDSEMVWEWWHPEMFDDPEAENFGKRHDLYRATRYDKGFVNQFLK